MLKYTMMAEYYRNLYISRLRSPRAPRYSTTTLDNLTKPRLTYTQAWIRAIRGSEVAQQEIVRGKITLIRVQVNSTLGNRVSQLEVLHLFPPICDFHICKIAPLKENQATTQVGYLLFHQFYRNSYAENFITEELTLILFNVVVWVMKPAFWRNIYETEVFTVVLLTRIFRGVIFVWYPWQTRGTVPRSTATTMTCYQRAGGYHLWSMLLSPMKLKSRSNAGVGVYCTQSGTS